LSHSIASALTEPLYSVDSVAFSPSLTVTDLARAVLIPDAWKNES